VIDTATVAQAAPGRSAGAGLVTGAALVTAAVVAIGCGALASRTALAAATPHPTSVLVAMFCVLLIGGAVLPLPAVAVDAPVADASGRARVSVVVAIVGVAAFAIGRALVGGHAPMAFTGYAVATSTLAAVAEELWFRRLCYGLLLPAGPAFAICGSTVLFAVVHVATYGWWVLPLDLAAGALLGWQRSVSGSWAAPAVTHVIANLLVLL
jgi:membrane protease YdiL (CAAX protease family)